MSKSDKRAAVRVDVKDDELVYQCEWDDCHEEFSCIKTFLHHIGDHIPNFSSESQQEENSYSCKWRECGSQIMGNVHDFNRHVFFHAFHVKLKCIGEVLIKKSKYPVCGIDGQSRNWIPELPEKLQCGWTSCGAVCDNPLVFYCHVAQHCESYNIGNFVEGGCTCHWTDCDSRFKSKYKLRDHLRSHTQEKVVSCPTCGGLFASRTKFFDHLTRQKESSVYCYQCSHCNKRFATERLLRDHMRHHVNHYRCPFCEMTVQAPSTLRTHIKYRHTEEKPYKCGHCDRRCKRASDLRMHLDSHNFEATYHCHVEKCLYVARFYNSLANHYKKMHQIQELDNYSCHLCNRKFTRGGQLTKHLKNTHKFKWPPGHVRFRYKAHEDGHLRLQTIRYESIEITEPLLEQTQTQTQAMEYSTHSSPPQHSSVKSENQENNDPSQSLCVSTAPPTPSGQETAGHLSPRSSNPPSVAAASTGSRRSARNARPGPCVQSGDGQHSSSCLPSPTCEGQFDSNRCRTNLPSPACSAFDDMESSDSEVSSTTSMLLPVLRPSGPGGSRVSNTPAAVFGQSSCYTSDDVHMQYFPHQTPDAPNQSIASIQQDLVTLPARCSSMDRDQGSSRSLGKDKLPEQALRADPYPGINFTLISNEGEHEEMQVQSLSLDHEGILVFSGKSDSALGRTNGGSLGSTEIQAQDTHRGRSIPILTHDDQAYNLDLLGEVALLEHNLT